MQELGMGGGRFLIELSPLENAEPAAHGDRSDRISCQHQRRPAPRAVAKVASGGELARLSLAVQVSCAGRRALHGIRRSRHRHWRRRCRDRRPGVAPLGGSGRCCASRTCRRWRLRAISTCASPSSTTAAAPASGSWRLQARSACRRLPACSAECRSHSAPRPTRTRC